MRKFRIALAGNPNSGKTTVFNALTGSRQRIGNWPGVTVERKEGEYRHRGNDFEVVDLPGIYCFSSCSLDEKISREYLLKEEPDLVVNVLDSTNLERNLYLTTQIIEMRRPLIVVLNMADIAARRGIRIEAEHLARHLDCVVITTVANRKEGIDELKNRISEAMSNRKVSNAVIRYDLPVEEALAAISEKAERYTHGSLFNRRWLAIKLLENDEIGREITNCELDALVGEFSHKIRKHTGEEAELAVIGGRYGFIHGLAKDVIRRNFLIRKTVSDAVDNLVLSHILGIPLFLLVMYLMFVLTMNLSRPFADFLDALLGAIFVDASRLLLLKASLPDWLVFLLSEGVGGGIRILSAFVPPVGFIFIFLSFLEDSGYMARAAFIMDRFFRKIGLPGKAFIPMIVGYGCNVPAILAARTLDNEKDRHLTILVNPFISCGARLPVYAVFISIFFSDNRGSVLFAIYLTGIVMAVLSSLLLRRTVFKGEPGSLVMELPPYHLPTMEGIFYHTWDRLKSFVIKAGKVIIIGTIILKVLESVGTDGAFLVPGSEKSILAKSGKLLQPCFAPMGIEEDNWPAVVSLGAGIFAKEAVIASLNSLYMNPETELLTNEYLKIRNEAFGKGMSNVIGNVKSSFFLLNPKGFLSAFKDPLGVASSFEESGKDPDSEATGAVFRKFFRSRNSVFAYLLFVLIYTPCAATVIVMAKEIGSKWAFFSVVFQTGAAWLVSTMFYQVSTLPDNPGRSLFWLFCCLLAASAGVLLLKNGIVKYEEGK